VRELENVVQRALAVSDGPRIGLAALPDELTSAPISGEPGARPDSLSYRATLAQARDRATRAYPFAVLEEVAGNVSHAAARSAAGGGAKRAPGRRAGPDAQQKPPPPAQTPREPVGRFQAATRVSAPQFGPGDAPSPCAWSCSEPLPNLTSTAAGSVPPAFAAR